MHTLVSVSVTVTQTFDFSELDRQLTGMYWKFARKYPVWGMDEEDVVQELRIKVWDVLSKGKFDPSRAKASTFFYQVMNNHCLNLIRSRSTRKVQDDMLTASTRSTDFDWAYAGEDGTDMSWSETQVSLSVPFDHYFCDRCQRLVDEHSAFSVTAEGILCARCSV